MELRHRALLLGSVAATAVAVVGALAAADERARPGEALDGLDVAATETPALARVSPSPTATAVDAKRRVTLDGDFFLPQTIEQVVMLSKGAARVRIVAVAETNASSWRLPLTPALPSAHGASPSPLPATRFLADVRWSDGSVEALVLPFLGFETDEEIVEFGGRPRPHVGGEYLMFIVQTTAGYSAFAPWFEVRGDILYSAAGASSGVAHQFSGKPVGALEARLATMTFGNEVYREQLAQQADVEAAATK